MILVDTSIWIDHLRRSNSTLNALLLNNQVAIHPMVIGELAMGSIKHRDAFLAALRGLPAATVATHNDVLFLVNKQSLFGLGLGFVDAHLLASAMLSDSTAIWTRDRRFAEVTERLSVAFVPN